MRSWFLGLIQARRRRSAPPLGPPGEPPGLDFDQLARDMAAGLSRRDALRRVGASLASAALAGLGLATGASATPSACNSYCKACTGTANRQCSDACLACGANPNNLCGPCGAKICKNLASDLNNCGACGNICPTLPNSSPTCVNGRCGFACNPGYATCGSASTVSGCGINLTNDVGNCGACGNACPVPPNTTPTCTNGVCGAVCRAGYADCNGSPVDGCEVSLLTDANHCGACGHRCPIGESCVSGHCTCGSLDADCPSGQVCCSQVCRSLQGDLNNCGACGNVCTAPANATAVCSGGVCSYACIGPYADCDGRADNGCETNIATDANNCGGCGYACAFPNGIAVCTAGTCELVGCVAGYGSCDGIDGNGCETNLNTTARHCGACGHACNPGEVCSGGSCFCNGGPACNPGQGCCSGACIDLQSNVNNCGACNHGCSAPANATAACANGICGFICRSGFGDCDLNPANGCEVNTQTDRNNCGACGHVCPNGQTCCEGGCVDLLSDPLYCGSCTRMCRPANVLDDYDPGQHCSNGVCCEPGFDNCGSGCVALAGDPGNCGACGNTCTGGSVCCNGHCCPSGWSCCNGHCLAPGQPCCPAGQTACGGACVDLQSDHGNCGTCGHTCLSIETCCSGRCVDTDVDFSNCGRCGNQCSPAQICLFTVCVQLT